MVTAYINKRELADTINQYSNQKDVLIQKLKDFTNHKLQYPSNGGGTAGQNPGFGGSDKKFRTDGNFGISVRNIAHAHLTDNISVTYLVDGDRLNIYGVYTHDAIGTGQPANVNRQKQIATRWSNMKFDAPFAPDEMSSPKKEKPMAAKPIGGKPDFTPKPKVAQPAVKSTNTNDIAALAQKVDSHWPQRNLFNKLKDAQDRNAAMTIINQEAQNIAGLRDRGARLYPNQLDYFKGLSALYSHYNK